MANITISTSIDIFETFARSDAATTNFQNRQEVRARHTSGGRKEPGFWEINQTALPASIDSMTTFRLDAFLDGAHNGVAGTIVARRLIVDWAESQLTWDKRTASNWNTVGAQGNGTDYATPVAVDSFASATSGSDGAAQSFDFTNDGLQWPKDWSDGTYANEGFTLWANDPGAGTQFTNVQSTDGGGAKPPTFYIEYSTGVGGQRRRNRSRDRSRNRSRG